MPSFASREYWDERFRNDSSPFDWLLPAAALRDVAEEWVGGAALRKAEILHIGCGTSDSNVLRELVDDPSQVHNVDYSAAAVEAARAREQDAQSTAAEHESPWEAEAEKHDSLQPRPQAQCMRWSCLDLLSLDSTLSLAEQQSERGRTLDLILDKSTSDSIACGSDIRLQLPYPLSINGWTRGVLASGVVQHADIHPLHVLAVHLAALTTPRTGKWIAISYSEERFPFLPPYPRSASHGFLPESAIQAGFPHPNQLWRLEARERIEPDAEEETLAQRRKRLKEGTVHRPKVSHWLYVLARTDVIVTD
jgi:SAM-dependent methyltransferase